MLITTQCVVLDPQQAPHQGPGNETNMVVVDQYASNSQLWPGNETTVVIYI